MIRVGRASNSPGEHAKGGVTTLPAVGDLEVFKDRVRQLDAGPPPLSVQQSTRIRDRNASMTALSKQSPTEFVEGTSPDPSHPRGGPHILTVAVNNGAAGVAVVDRHAERVGCSVMSVTHSWSGPLRANRRSTRSAAVGQTRHAAVLRPTGPAGQRGHDEGYLLMARQR